jgi:hypothetical protein
LHQLTKKKTRKQILIGLAPVARSPSLRWSCLLLTHVWLWGRLSVFSCMVSCLKADRLLDAKRCWPLVVCQCASNLAAPGLKALGATRVCHGTWCGYGSGHRLLETGGIWGSALARQDDAGLSVSPSPAPFCSKGVATLSGVFREPEALPAHRESRGRHIHCFLRLLFFVHTLSCSGGALRRFSKLPVGSSCIFANPSLGEQ